MIGLYINNLLLIQPILLVTHPFNQMGGRKITRERERERSELAEIELEERLSSMLWCQKINGSLLLLKKVCIVQHTKRT